MDTTPPQAPPALTQSSRQEAANAFDRLVALQAWLATEQAGMPSLPETIEVGSLAPYLAQVEAYWSAVPTSASGEPSRRAALAGRVAVAVAVRDLAVLAHEDGNLDDDALVLIREVVSTGSASLPAHVSVRELMFGETAYAGSFLLQDSRAPDRTLSFSAETGWESFPTLDAAHAEMERRARDALVSAPDLAGIARQNLLDISPEVFVTSREIAGHPFDSLVGRMIDVQRDKLHQAWFQFALARHEALAAPVGADGEAARMSVLVDTVFDALRLDRSFDIARMLAVRHAALLQAFNTERLARVPAYVALHWQDAEAAYSSTLRAVAGREAEAGLATPPSLAEYAATALGERLRVLGVTHHPADIQIRVDRNTDPAVRLESLQALFEGPAPLDIRLVDLAYQNIAAFDPVRLSAHASDGSAIAGLDGNAIRHLVRGLDLSSRYQGFVDTTFRSGPEAAMRQEHAASVQLAHMSFQAAEARLSYFLTDAPSSFRFDRAERGYQWVRAALDAPVATQRALVEGHEIVVRQITYQGTPLRDLLVFGVRNPGSVPGIVLYTPDAPDGVTFREFDDRAEAGRRFFYHPAFREYLLDRLPADDARVLPNGSAREFAGDRLANWVLGSSSSAAYTRTVAPFEEREVAGDFLAAAYEVDVQLGLRNARTMMRSAEQANWVWLVDRSRTAMSNRMLEDAVKGIVTAPARAAQAAWRLYDNVKAGDNAQAVVDFAEFYNVSLSAAAPVHALSSGSLSRAIVGARFRAAGRLVEARPAVQPLVVFDQRYIARGVRKTSQANHEGIYSIEGNTYIEHNGKLYAVRYDIDYATWRLHRPSGGNAFRGPAIQRTGIDSWAYNSVGLRGGSGRGAAGAAAQESELFNEYVHELERVFPDPFERDLVRMQMRGELTNAIPAAHITAAQRLRWNEAVGRAHVRSRELAQAYPLPPVGIPESMTVPRIPTPPPAPPGYGHVALPDVPEVLWYYGTKPFKRSALERMHASSGQGFNPNWAQIRTAAFDQGLNGIRLTTVPPTAPIEQIRAATGLRLTPAGETFAVRIHPRHMLTVHERGQTTRANLLVSEEGPAGTYIMRPSGDATRITLHGHEHTVLSKLP